MKPKLLLVAPSFHGPGGSACLAAWALQALYREYDVSVLAWEPQDFAVMNQRFGTNLPADGARRFYLPARLRRLVDAMPLRLALVRRACIELAARRILRQRSFDLVVSADNEMYVGPPMVQYINYPWASYPRPQYDLRWYHLAPLLRAYRGLISIGLGYSKQAVARNLTLVNSAWTGQRYAAWYEAPCEVLYPPAPVAVPAEGLPSWAERRSSFICLGRLAPEKRILENIAMLRQLRAEGFDISLDICGQIDDAGYYRRILAAVEAAGDWVRLHLDLPRSQLTALIASSRYGIHGMIGEHFGIAVAELIRLGCICFANRNGGPAEILQDQRLLFDSDTDAVGKIRAVLTQSALQDELQVVVRERGLLFSPEKFMAGLQEYCAGFAAKNYCRG